MKNALVRLQEWYLSQCNGDWGHGRGVRIDTLDNPGWAIDISIVGTNREDTALQSFEIERNNDDWIHFAREDGTVKIRCGPISLEESINRFLDAVE